MKSWTVLSRRVDSDAGDVRLVFVVCRGDEQRELVVSPTTFREVADGVELVVRDDQQNLSGVVWRRSGKARATAHAFVDGRAVCSKSVACVEDAALPLTGDVCEECRDALVPSAKKQKRQHRGKR